MTDQMVIITECMANQNLLWSDQPPSRLSNQVLSRLSSRKDTTVSHPPILNFESPIGPSLITCCRQARKPNLKENGHKKPLSLFQVVDTTTCLLRVVK